MDLMYTEEKANVFQEIPSSKVNKLSEIVDQSTEAKEQEYKIEP